MARPLVYLHLHKAGGTTACALMELGPLRVRGSAVGCLCKDHDFLSSLRRGDGAAVARSMRVVGLDACFVENVSWWPKPANLPTLKEHVRIVTTLRHPWARLLSNYERDVVLCGGCAVHSASLQRYMAMKGCYPSIRHSVQLPDFYVRSLAGKATRSRKHVPRVNGSDLYAAQGALRSFDAVFLLEDADFTDRIAALARVPKNATTRLRRTNNIYSAVRQPVPIPPCIRRARASGAYLREPWLQQQSRLDAQLYEWARRIYGSHFASSE
jgi:hypothetical protein